jgi:hypothetical protein
MRGSNFFYLMVLGCVLAGCANISSPTGGKKDRTPPKLTSVSPADSQLNARITRLELRFDEYITLGDARKEINISPILLVPPAVTGINKHVVVKIEDSLLEDNTTYRISFGNAVRDLHENNPFTGYTYTFSTGSYFDSLQLAGTVIDAITGMPDTSGLTVVLHRSGENDSAIVRRRPRYKVSTDSKGNFIFKGLPGRSFRMYAIKDDNENLIYDGGGEKIAFSDSLVFPADSVLRPVRLLLFTEVPDSSSVTDSVKTEKKGMRLKDRFAKVDTNLVFSVNLDTSDVSKRSFDLTDSIKLRFNKYTLVSNDSIRITRDSAGSEISVPFLLRKDSLTSGVLCILARYAENTVYTLHLNGGFAKDTLGHSATPGVYRFRTFNDDDYGKITLNLPAKYYGAASGKAAVNTAQTGAPDYILTALAGEEVVYSKRVTDTVVFFKRVRPAKYTFRIIADKNRNGKWDAGDLFSKRQPEEVIPGPQPLVLKASWEHTIDFEQVVKSPDKKGGMKGSVLPKK